MSTTCAADGGWARGAVILACGSGAGVMRIACSVMRFCRSWGFPPPGRRGSLAVSDSVGWLCGASLSLPSPSVAVTFQAAVMRQGFPARPPRGRPACRAPGHRVPGSRRGQAARRSASQACAPQVAVRRAIGPLAQGHQGVDFAACLMKVSPHEGHRLVQDSGEDPAEQPGCYQHEHEPVPCPGPNGVKLSLHWCKIACVARPGQQVVAGDRPMPLSLF
jgi:hypothetical protein